MIAWLLIFAVYTVLLYLSDIGVLPFLKELKVPFFNASLTSVLLLICIIAMLGRVLGKLKKKDRESLESKVIELEQELKALKEKYE